MLRLEETRITQLLKETIRVICRSADSCSEIAVQGLLGITLDRKEIFLVQINDVIDIALERTGTAFHASGSSALQSSRGLLSQAAEQLQSRQDLNLNADPGDGGMLNDLTIPENRLTRQRWNNSSVADSANHSMLWSQGQKGGTAKAKGSSSLIRLSDVQGSQDCSTTSKLEPSIANPQPIPARTPFACVSNSGRGRGRGLFGRGRGLLQRGRGLLGRGRGQCGRGRGLLGRGRGQCGKGRELLGRGGGQCGKDKQLMGRGRGYRGRSRGRRLVVSSYRNKDMSLSASGLSGVPDDVKMRTRRSFISETHSSTVISTVNNYSEHLEKLKDENGSQIVSTVKQAEHKTLKTLKQPAFKRKLKPFGVITSKKSRRANCFADSGVVIIQPLVSSSEQPLNRCSVCKREFSRLTDLADHYTREHSTTHSTGLSAMASPVFKSVQNETLESIKCAIPLCGRTFPTQRGMLQHCGRIHHRFVSGNRGRCYSMGTVRHSSRIGTHDNVDDNSLVGSVVGQIIPSLSFLFEPGVNANVQTHNLPHTVTSEAFNQAETDNHAARDVTPSSSLTIVKEEVDDVVYTGHTE